MDLKDNYILENILTCRDLYRKSMTSTSSDVLTLNDTLLKNLTNKNVEATILINKQARYDNADVVKMFLPFVPKLVLTNAGKAVKDYSWREVILNLDDWSCLQQEFDRIDSYFNDDDCEFWVKYDGVRTVRTKNIKFFFGVTYVSKSLLVSSIQKSQKRALEQTNHEVKKIPGPAITLQMITYGGLKELSKCINSRIREHEKTNKIFTD